MRPAALITRHHGTSLSSGSADSAHPTARAAPGRPASRATSPYVATRPGGIRRTTCSTRAVKSDVLAISLQLDDTAAVRSVGRRRSGDDFERELLSIHADDHEMMRVVFDRRSG